MVSSIDNDSMEPKSEHAGDKPDEITPDTSDVVSFTASAPPAAPPAGTAAPPPPPPPPHVPAAADGGTLAWLQCAGAFVLFLNTWGIVNSFGVFQTYYEEDLLRDESSSNISWIGSTQTCLLVIGGVIAGPLFDRGYLRTLVAVGSVLVVLGMMLTSLCTTYWQFVLAQGIVVGLGNGALFIPMVAVLPTYFQARRALAMGIAASGSSIGGVIYPIIFHELQPNVGFEWTTRVIAFIMLGTLVVPVACMRTRVLPPTTRKLFDASAWKEAPYVLFGISYFFGFLGLYIPFFYVQLDSLHERIVTGSLVFYLLPILNAGSFFGRLIPNAIADKAGPLNTMAFCTLVTAVLGFAWIEIETTAAMVVFCVLYGFFSGSFVSLSTPVIASALCPNMGVLGVRIGMLAIPTAIGVLIGNPIAGAIVDSGWVGLQSFCGTMVALSGVFMIIARVIKVGPSLSAKV